MSEPKETALVTQVAALTPPDTAPGAAMVAREVAGIQGAMMIAKKFPRDEQEAIVRISRMCKRKSLAEVAAYEYSKGGQKVTGPSIRLAEALAQAWGNIDSGFMEIERRDGESLCLSYAVDLETNYRKSMTFTVPHTRDAQGQKKTLTSDRDIYERIANDGARRLRACILAVIPGDICDQAVEECMNTLKSDQIPREERIEKMLVALSEFGVTKEMIELTYGCKATALTENQLVNIRAKYQSVRDGIGVVSEHFKSAKPDTAGDLAKSVGAAQGASPQPQAQAKAEPAVKKAEKEPKSPPQAEEPGNFDFEGPSRVKS